MTGRYAALKLAVLCLACGLGAQAADAQWVLSQQPILRVGQMQVPESVCFDPESRLAYVSNIVGEGWEKDYSGFITRLKPDGSVDVLRWRERTPDAVLSAPKGMCLLEGSLYVADIDMVHRFALEDGEAQTLVVQGAARLNDMCTDGESVYASDTETGKVWKLSADLSEASSFEGVPSINGIAVAEGRFYAVSWDEPDVYELDPTGARPARAFGVGGEFVNLDGIEVLADGCMVISDFIGNKIGLVAADGKSAKVILETKTPADIGLDREGGRLFIPEFYGTEVTVHRLTAE